MLGSVFFGTVYLFRCLFIYRSRLLPQMASPRRIGRILYLYHPAVLLGQVECNIYTTSTWTIKALRTIPFIQ
jgi:hypothetical protein